MPRPSPRRAAALPVAVGVLALGGLAGCSAADAPTSDASPASQVAPGDGPAAVSVPERPGGGSARQDPEAVARAYAAFATSGDGGAVRFADRVTYRIGGVDVRTFTAREAARPGPWRACQPAESTYEGRDCPVSPLRSLAQLERDGAAVEVEQGWPDSVGCTDVTGAEVAADATAVTLRPPPQRRDCFSDVGVLLRLDGGGRIDLVELVLSGS